MQASRKFPSTCLEIRLAHNKIVSANFPKILALMGNLKAIDLGNNWIHSLDDVRGLAALGLTSLRLDGNPLCNDYAFCGEYIKAVKKYFTDLTKLVKILNVFFVSDKSLSFKILGWHWYYSKG